MKENLNSAPFELRGRWQYRFRSLIIFCWSLVFITTRRLLKGARFPNWNWTLESSTYFTKQQTKIAFDMLDIEDGREYEDSFMFASPALAKVKIEPVTAPVKGHWVQPKAAMRPVTVLYLHGGGYAYYSRAHHNLIALVTLSVGSRTFALDYRLTPEHAFPAQLEDAMAAYRWLIQSGVEPGNLVVMGDSAGGNLSLALLLALKEAQEPLPAMAVCISPWTDATNSGQSMTGNESHDWVEKRMPVRWAGWYCKDTLASHPLVSPVNADLIGLPPVYIQAGSAEILRDMIISFAENSKKQGAQVRLEVWENMTHDFQAYGDLIPESQEALRRIGEIVREYVS